MEVTREIDEQGFCLIEINIILRRMETYEKSVIETTIAMIDTGATHFAIDEALAEKLKLPIINNQVEVRGFESGMNKQTKFEICLPSLSKHIILPVSAILMNTHDRPFKVIIGASYLKYVEFTRNGPKKTFTISIQE